MRPGMIALGDQVACTDDGDGRLRAREAFRARDRFPTYAKGNTGPSGSSLHLGSLDRPRASRLPYGGGARFTLSIPCRSRLESKTYHSLLRRIRFRERSIASLFRARWREHRQNVIRGPTLAVVQLGGQRGVKNSTSVTGSRACASAVAVETVRPQRAAGAAGPGNSYQVRLGTNAGRRKPT